VALSIGPEVAVGDGALDKVPLSVQPKMKQDLREICLAPNRPPPKRRSTLRRKISGKVW